MISYYSIGLLMAIYIWIFVMISYYSIGLLMAIIGHIQKRPKHVE